MMKSKLQSKFKMAIKQEGEKGGKKSSPNALDVDSHCNAPIPNTEDNAKVPEVGALLPG